MSTHECLAANTLNYPKLRLARCELQDSLAVWPAAGQVAPPDADVPCLDSDAAADALLINLRYDTCSALMARFRRRAMLNIDPGELQVWIGKGKSTSLRIPYASREGLTKMSAPACARTLAILSFHKIGAPSDHEWNTWFYIPEKVFIDQLEWLRKNDWDVIGIHDFFRGLSDPSSLHERSVLLTFDDGYQSMATIALPCLQRFGYPAVVFVPTDYIGATNSFDLDNEPVERICSWDELRGLEAGGVTVQSHGVTHRTFSELSPDDQREEVEHSKSILEQGLHTTVSTFAFPFGDGGASETVTPMVAKAGYRAAFLYGANSVYLPEHLPVCDAYRLDRVAMGPDTDLGGILGEAVVRSTS